MELDFLKYIGSPVVAVVAIIAIIVYKGEWLFKPIINKLDDKEHKEQTRTIIKNNLILLFQNALRHTPLDEHYIRQLWSECEKLGINGGIKRMYEAWEQNHTIYHCPIKSKTNEILYNRRDVPNVYGVAKHPEQDGTGEHQQSDK